MPLLSHRVLACSIWILAIILSATGCARVECQINTDCPGNATCVANVCRFQCREDRDCPTDRPRCSVNGFCEATSSNPDATVEASFADTQDSDQADRVSPPRDTIDPRDASPDRFVTDVVVDTSTAPDVVSDIAAPDTFTPDTTVPPVDVAMDTRLPPFDAPTDSSTPPTDVPAAIDSSIVDVAVAIDTAPIDVPTDTGPGPRDVPENDVVVAPADTSMNPPPDVMTGPVPIGVYSYRAVPAIGIINPPAAAWHTSGDYALVLNNSDQVYRFDPVTNALTAVASAGTSVVWRAIAFAPDGANAVVLGNVASPVEGRVYVWNHAAGTLTERMADRFAGGTYESIEWSHDGQNARLLGQRPNSGSYLAYIWPFDVTTGRGTPAARATSAGCQDLTWATDAFDLPAPAITCGLNGVTLLHIDGGGSFVLHTDNAGNTSRIASRPQGDYALAIGWSGQRLYRFERGLWTTAFGSPNYPGIFQVQFSTDGARALILGGYGGNPAVGRVVEFRHDLYTQSDITDVSIPSFALPPYNAQSGVTLNDAAWRPGCEAGIIVGGANSFTLMRGYVIRFSVDNGQPCPN